MKNSSIGRYEAEDLRRQVEKVLRGLGNPEPPLDLRDVRELLRLDRQYYSSKDDSAVREFVSKLTIAGKQILARPTLLLDIIRKADISALWVPDRKRILIDADLPQLKHRWAETHEISHSIAPWHRGFLFGDSEEELRLSCHEKLESEANYTAGQLLFLQERFTAEANDLPITLKVIRDLAKEFGNTMTSTLWRFVEETHPGLPMVGIVSPNPNRLNESDYDFEDPCRYCIESPAFRERFGQMTEFELFRVIAEYCKPLRAGPLGEVEALLRDRNGDAHTFRFQSFGNGYDVLTLGVYLEPRGAPVAGRSHTDLTSAVVQ